MENSIIASFLTNGYNLAKNFVLPKKKYDKIEMKVRKYEINENIYYNSCKSKEVKLTTTSILTDKEIDLEMLKIITKTPLSVIFFLEELNSKRSKYINMKDFQYQKVTTLFSEICNIIYNTMNNIIDNKQIKLETSTGTKSFEGNDFMEEQQNVGDDKLFQWEPLRAFDRNKNVINMFIEYPETIKRLKKYIYILEYIVILSQTFYGMIEEKRESMVDKIKNCRIWNDKLIWELMILTQILTEKQRQEDIFKCKLTQTKIETIETTTLITYLFNLDNFGKSHLKDIIKDDVFQFTYITSIEMH